MALPLFHAITGCDTISHFLGCGKTTAGASWQNTPGLTETLLALTNAPSCFSLGSLHMQHLERFVVITYSKGCGLAKVNEARHRLFTSGKKRLWRTPHHHDQLSLNIQRERCFRPVFTGIEQPRNPGFPQMGVAKGIQWYLVALLDNIPKCQ